MENYKPIKVLGEGSFGKVYLMREISRRELCCVKVMKIKNLPKKEREACRMEVDLMKRLVHPNIVHYKDSFLSKNKDALCICMEYCDGGDLSTKIENQKDKLFTETLILHYFVQMTLGLHYMHSNRVLHRDLKTQNIFLTGNGRLVLGDLGISKVMEGTQDFARTCIGTPYYMSPEIFKNKPYNHKSDIWALGCVLYEMTTLNHAFDSNSLNGLACKIIKGRYPSIHPNFSSHLRNLIAGMLAVNPGGRPDLETILRIPFIKKHVSRFFGDIASRSAGDLGDGTMVLSKVGDALTGADVDDDADASKEIQALIAQLESLDMANLIAAAVGKPPTTSKVAAPSAIPSSSRLSQQQPSASAFAIPVAAPLPTDERLARAQEREQAAALQREEERRANVEAALQRLRLERAERQKARKPIEVHRQQQQQQQQLNAGLPQMNARPMPVWQQPPPGKLQPRMGAGGQQPPPQQLGGGKERSPPADSLAQQKLQEIRKHAEQRKEEERRRRSDRASVEADALRRAAESEQARRIREEELQLAARSRAEAAAAEKRREAEAERLRRRQQELEEWERAQTEQAEQEARRKRLTVAAESARRKQEEEENVKRMALLAKRREDKRNSAFEALRRDKLELDNKLAKLRPPEEKREEEIERQLKELSELNDGGLTPRQASSPPSSDSPIGELPVVYSSFESTTSSGGSNKSAFSTSGAANAIVKDPFARAEKEARAKAAHYESSERAPAPTKLVRGPSSDYASNGPRESRTNSKDEQESRRVAEKLNSIIGEYGPRYGSDKSAAGPSRGVGNPSGGVAKRAQAPSSRRVGGRESSDEEDARNSSDSSLSDDEILNDRSRTDDSSDEEEEDATLQKRAQMLEHELTLATKRCHALKATLEATKQATQQAIKQGILTPARPAPGKTPKSRRFDGSDEDDGDSTEEDDDFEAGDDEYYSEEGSEGGIRDDDPIAIRRAEAKLGLEPSGRPSQSGDGASMHRAESKSLYQRRTEEKGSLDGGDQLSGRQQHSRHIVTPRVVIDDASVFEASGDHFDATTPTKARESDAAREARYKELCDAPSPSARIDDRVAALRMRCENGLGKATFIKAYNFLKELTERQQKRSSRNAVPPSPGSAMMEVGGESEYGEDNEEHVLLQLTDILGEDNLHYWSLVDQLLFCEDLRKVN